MHIYFSGIGGVGIGPLGLIAHKLGYQVSGSDMHESDYIDVLAKEGLNIHIGQSLEAISEVHSKTPIDWFVYSSALPLHNPDHPELEFIAKNGIKNSKRDEFLNHILKDNDIELLAIAGTHGKTTTTAMAVWLMQQAGGLDFGYSVGGKLPFGPMGDIQPGARWFVYEADEFDRNFLAFKPSLSIITGVAYDHHEIYPTKNDYDQAFRDFISQSQSAYLWQEDATALYGEDPTNVEISSLVQGLTLAGEVNRRDASQAIQAVSVILGIAEEDLVQTMNGFPGASRRFEYINQSVISDYAHTPEKIAGCLDIASELGKDIVVIHEPLTNRRQHHIKHQYKDLFLQAKHLYWIPSYLAREDESLDILSPQDLIAEMSNPEIAEAAEMSDALKAKIDEHIANGDIVVGLSGGGANSLDHWLRSIYGSS